MMGKLRQVQWKVTGMHCAACVQLVRQELEPLGLQGLTVNLKRGKLDFDFAGSAEEEARLLADSHAKLVPLGFDVQVPASGGGGQGAGGDGAAAAVGQPMPAGKNALHWVLAFAFAAGIAGLFMLLQRSGIVENLAPALGDGGITTSSQLSGMVGVLVFALAMGLVASLSSCLAVVGSLVIGFGALASGSSVWKPNLLFHAGRIGTFVLMGIVLGAVGGSLNLSGTFMGIFQMVVAALMVFVALSILGFGALAARFGLHLPKGVNQYLNRLRTSNNPFAAMALGALSFILPCGFTQSMQLFALSSGSAMVGAMALGLFAVGTAPVLLAAGTSAAWSAKGKFPAIQRAMGLLVLAFALLTFVSGFRVAGSGDAGFGTAGVQGARTQAALSPSPVPASLSSSALSPPAAPAEVLSQVVVQKVAMRVKYTGFEPEQIVLKAGQPVEWTVWGDEVTGCTNAIIIPDLSIKFKVRKGANVVTFTAPETPGTMDYSCWMGMVWGSFKIVK